jgi:hypothetical protein
MKSNYLKYWRVVKYYVKRRWDLSEADLDIILFLYSEDYFSRDRFEDFERVISWDSKRFKRLLTEGWITVFRQRSGKQKTLYQLSFRASQVVDFIYEKLNHSVPFPPIKRKQNYVMRLKMGETTYRYTDKLYQKMIEEMNAVVKEGRMEKIKQPQRRHAQE